MIRLLFGVTILLFSTFSESAEQLFLAEVVKSEIEYKPVDRTVYQLKVLEVLNGVEVPSSIELIIDKVITVDAVATGRIVLVSRSVNSTNSAVILDVYSPDQEYYWSSEVFRLMFSKVLRQIIQNQNNKHKFTREGVIKVTLAFNGLTPSIFFSSMNTSTEYLIVLQYYSQRIGERFAKYIEPETETTFLITTHEYQTEIIEVAKPFMEYTLEQKIKERG